MDIHEFHRALGEALEHLTQVANYREQADAAQRRLSNVQQELGALSDAQASMRADSDAHLAANRAKFAAERAEHENILVEMKKNQLKLGDLHRSQEEAASSTLTALNTDIARKLKAKDELAIQIEQMKSTIHDLASRL